MRESGVLSRIMAGVLAAATLIIAGCGGGGGGSSSGGTGYTVSGVVTDPPVEGAAVRLEDADGDVLTLIERTDARGRFSFSLDGPPPSGARIVARGGVDTVTGQDFQGLELSAPYDADSGKSHVTPLTTLVERRMQKRGASLQDARSRVADLLDLDPAAVTADPAGDASAQRASMLAAELLVALRGSEEPLARAAEALEGSSGQFDQAAAALSGDSDLSSRIRERLEGVERRAEALMDRPAGSGASAQEIIAALGQINIRDGLRTYLEDQGLTPDDDQVATLAEAIWQGAGGTAAPAGSPALLNSIRYILDQHGIAAADLATSGQSLPTGAVAADSVLPSLMASRVIDHTIPLASGEALGTDNQVRLDYFFRSDVSPYYRTEQLISDVYDDGARDPVYVNVAAGLAGAGLLEQAELVLQANIFQPPQRAEAMRQVGNAQHAIGDTETAHSYWKDALRTYEDYFDSARGDVENMTSDDAKFFQNLRSSFRRGGYDEDADRAMELVRSFIDANGGSYTTAYGRLTTAARDAAEDAVAAIEEQGPDNGRQEQAESALDLFGDAVYGLGTTGVACNLRSMHLVDYADLALQLADQTAASEAVTDYESLATGATGDCSGFAVGRAGDMASVYGRLGLVSEFNDLVDNYVEPADADDAAEARARLAVYEALDMARNGNVSAAITTVEDAQENIQAQIEYLTTVGSGGGRGGRPYLARLLWQEGEKSAARQVADAAWGLAVSDGYAQEASDAPGTFVGQGCRKVARLYEWLEQPEKAKSRARACADRAQEVFAGSTTDNQAKTAEQLGYLHLWVGLTDEALAFSDSLYGVGSYLAEAEERVKNRRRVAELRSSAGETARAMQALKEAVAKHLPRVASTSGDDEALVDALYQARWTARAYLDIVTDVRERVTENGMASQQQQDWVDEARGRVSALLTDGGNLSGWAGARAFLDALNDPEERADTGSLVVGLLAAARDYDNAEELARAAEQDPVRNARLVKIAEGLGGQTIDMDGIVGVEGWDDFPGTNVAHYDHDGDGEPDFFSKQSTSSERASSALRLDTDIDGDGDPDTSDRTPYCDTCQT
ncbi:carboxypeptidase-like regulatory domain-containing protein [Thiohalorhabdus methylotrophus]|uniref:Carboxypeptidase-like regulatory domain-containing protein n=1 Tax=Thiohalorhabdus methylotrophus TaxID=3242694 RepID=A0ABV4TQK2_9GAMM